MAFINTLPATPYSQFAYVDSVFKQELQNNLINNHNTNTLIEEPLSVEKLTCQVLYNICLDPCLPSQLSVKTQEKIQSYFSQQHFFCRESGGGGRWLQLKVTNHL